MRGTHTLFLSVHIVFNVLVLHTVPQCAASVSECFPKHRIQEYEHYISLKAASAKLLSERVVLFSIHINDTERTLCNTFYERK